MNEINKDMAVAVELPVVEATDATLAPVAEDEVVGYVQVGEGEVATEVTVI